MYLSYLSFSIITSWTWRAAYEAEF